MRAFLAVARDALREAAEERLSAVLAAVAVAVGVGAFAISGLEEVPVEAFVAAALEDTHARHVAVERAGPRAVDLLAAPGAAPAAVTRAAIALAAVLEERGVRSVRATGAAPGRARLELDYDPLDARGASRLAIASAMTGSLEGEDAIARFLAGMTGRESVVTIESAIAQIVAGWAGVLVFLVATAGFVPSMLAGGTAHLLLAKPVARSTLLLGKYAGGVAFVALHAALVTALAAAGILFRTGILDLRFVALAPLAVTSVFAVLYAASALAGVLFETPALSVLGALVLWLLSWGAFAARTGPRAVEAVFGERVEIAGGAKLGIEAVYWALPKTTDMYVAFDEALKRGRRPPEAEREAAEMRRDVSGPAAYGTSLAFAAVLLGVACVSFERRDY